MQLEDLVQSAFEQTFAEIMHGTDCRLCLLRQNPFAEFPQQIFLGFQLT